MRKKYKLCCGGWNLLEGVINENVQRSLLKMLYDSKKTTTSISTGYFDVVDTDNKPFSEDALDFLFKLYRKHHVKIYGFYEDNSSSESEFRMIDISPTDLDRICLNDPKQGFVGFLIKPHSWPCKDENGNIVNAIYIDTKTINFWLYFKYSKFPELRDKINEFCKKYKSIFSVCNSIAKLLVVLSSIKILGIWGVIKHLLH
jgi:hypothetical protein